MPRTTAQPASDVSAPPAAASVPAVAPDSLSIWPLLRRALGGRYRLAILLGLAGALVGGDIGWKCTRRLYGSEGVVRIASALPEVMWETDQNRPMPMYDAFLQSQQLLIGSRSLIEAALHDPAWRATGRDASPAAVEDFSTSLSVEAKPRTDYLRITFTDAEPTVAAAGVRAVVNAYQKAYSVNEAETQHQRVKVLEDRRESLRSQLADSEAQMRAAAERYGSANVDPLYFAAMQQVIRLEAAIADVQQATALTPAAPPAPEAAQAPKRPQVVTAEQIAMVDPLMRKYLDEQTRLEEALRRTTLQFGEAHWQVVQLKQSLMEADDRIARYLQDYRTFQAMSGSPSAAGKGGPLARADALPADEAALRKLHDQARQEMVTLGAKRMELEHLRADGERLRTELAEVGRRIDAVQDEGAIGGRLSVVSSGDVPLAPLRTNQLRNAGAAAACGALVPLSLMVLIGLARPRYRSCGQAAVDFSGVVPAFAMLPALPERPGARLAAEAAQSVHDVRVRLDAGDPERCVYLVTGAAAGEGKTSLTLALGLSFVASGCRTLVIDCDFVVRGLSRALGAGGAPGIYESLPTGSPLRHVKTMRTGLSVLTTGRIDESPAFVVPSRSLRQLIEQARERFDVVLVDCGPVPGSVEASVLAHEADGIVFAVARGQQRSPVMRALAHLESVGTGVCAVVFNHATPVDFKRSTRTSASDRRGRGGGGADDSKTADPCPLGPLVGAVLTSLRFTRPQDLDLLAVSGPDFLSPRDAETLIRSARAVRRPPGPTGVAA